MTSETASPTRRTLKATISYDGTNYVGWERQDNGPSIQAVLEDALEKLERRPVEVFGSGRTDAGVHALGQVAHFCIERDLPIDRIRLALNAMSPPDIAVRELRHVSDQFHARFSATWKRYRYTVVAEPVGRPLDRHRSFHFPRAIDIDVMRTAAEILVGTHDFRAFAKEAWRRKDCVRTVLALDLSCDGGLLQIDVTGTGFLYNMVRILTGTLLEVGVHRRSLQSVAELLGGGERARAGFTAPAHGLTLMEVGYPPHLEVPPSVSQDGLRAGAGTDLGSTA